MKHQHKWQDKEVLLQKVRIEEKTLEHTNILIVRQRCDCGEERTMRREEAA